MRALFLRLLRVDDKAAALAEAMAVVCEGRLLNPAVHLVDPTSFRQVPGSPFAYWVNECIRRLFTELPPFEGEGRTVRVGLQTSNDLRFVRAWWEVAAEKILDGTNGPDWQRDLPAFQAWCRKRMFDGKRWVPFAKGGEYSPYYADLHLVVNWERDGEEIRYFERAFIRNEDFYFRPGLTWSDRTAKRFGPRPLSVGVIISVKGSGGYSPSESVTWGMLGFMCSRLFLSLMDLIVGATSTAKSYQAGTIGRVPTHESVCTNLTIQSAAKACYQLRAGIDTGTEIAHVFHIPALLQVQGQTLAERIANWQAKKAEAEQKLTEYQREIDDTAFRLYGIEGEDRQAIEEGTRSESVGINEEAEEMEADE